MAKEIGRHLEEQVCKALGLDPMKIAHIELTFDSKGLPFASIKMYLDGPAGDKIVSELNNYTLVRTNG